MFENGMNKEELDELFEQIVEVLEDEDASADEKLAEIESILLGDDEED